jgi:hypothetical protein
MIIASIINNSCTIFPHKDMNGFVQHLEPRACVGNDSVVFPPQLKMWYLKKLE